MKKSIKILLTILFLSLMHGQSKAQAQEKTFEEKAIVHQIDDGTGISKYALCEIGCNCEIEQDLHLHFHCSNCSETFCLTEHKIPHINLPEGYFAEDVNLVVKGICEKCSG